MYDVTAATHPLLDPGVFLTTFPKPLSLMASPDWLQAGLQAEVTGSIVLPAPIKASDTVRSLIRALLRHGGFKPSGRSKPASEYLQRASADGALGSINVAVDACNVVSLHSGLPISVVDVDRARPPFSIGIALAGQSYVFNATGQAIDLEGLLCLCDSEGPCGNPVKDSQRTKTQGDTHTTLSIVWGHRELPGYTEQVTTWYIELLHRAGAETRLVQLQQMAPSS